MLTMPTTPHTPTADERPTPSRTLRRLYVLLFYTGSGIALGTQFVKDGLPSGLYLGTLISMTVLAMITAFLLFRIPNLWNIGNAPDQQLDERQVRIRNHAYRLAYSGLGTLILFTFFYGSIAIDKGFWLPATYGEASALMWIYLILALTLPTTVLAWMEREI